MDINKIRKYQIFSAIFVAVLGTLLHFTYQISGENNIVAIFSAINESTWEHLKLLFFPMLISTIIGYFYIGKDIANYICSKAMGIIISMLFTVVFFYTYSGIIGKNIAFLDISSFFVSVILGEFVSYLLMVNKFKCNNIVLFAVLTIIFISFIVFTYNTPKLGIFKDPLTGKYRNDKKINFTVTVA